MKRVRSLDDLVLDDELRAWCAEQCPSVDADEELERFADWCRAKGKRWKDYTAAFRNWMRKARDDQRGRDTGHGPRTGRDAQIASALGAPRRR